LVEHQFREPMAYTDIEEDSLSQFSGINITQQSSLHEKRPSDFRRLSIVLQRDKSKQSELMLLKKHEEVNLKSEKGQAPIKQKIMNEIDHLIGVVDW
jgi:hypothetical protein